MVPALIGVAFLTLLERKVLRIVGFRLGPNKVSFYGIFQPLADAFKLANKRVNLLNNFSFFFYYLSSFFILLMSISLFSCFFVFPSPVFLKYSILIFFFALGFNRFNSILCGWRSFRKFSLIGSIRTVSQLISYEAVLYICFFILVISFSRFRFSSMLYMNLSLLFIFAIPVFYIWIPTFLAELNRTPYDFSEGERELVSGFNTEFGSGCFTLIFLAEYSNIIFFCIISSFLFFFKTLIYPLILIYMVIWFRSVLPRFRFDKLMSLAWKIFIPFLTFFYLFFCIYFVFFFFYKT